MDLYGFLWGFMSFCGFLRVLIGFIYEQDGFRDFMSIHQADSGSAKNFFKVKSDVMFFKYSKSINAFRCDKKMVSDATTPSAL